MIAFALLAAVSAAEILQTAFENEQQQGAARAQYVYREHLEHRQPPRNGVPGKRNFSHDYEWICLEGASYRRLIAINGKPLSGKKSAEEARKFQLTRQQRIAEAAAKKPNRRGIAFGNVAWTRAVASSEVRLDREENHGGRRMWVVVAEPRSDATGPEACYRHTFWIDQEDRVVAASEQVVIRQGVDAVPGSRSLSVRTRLAPSLWLPSRLEGEFFTGPPGRQGHWVEIKTFDGWKKFDAESKIEYSEP